jgi:hypothetical protein
MNNRMRYKLFLFVSVLFFFSCHSKKKNNNTNFSNENIYIISNKNNTIKQNCIPKDTLEFQNKDITVFNEYIMRGDGVIELNFSNSIVILNEDGTEFGKIDYNEGQYKLKIPNQIVARSFVPDLERFYFDAKEPIESSPFLEIYINKHLKRIDKDKIKYSFTLWKEYVSKRYLKLIDCSNNLLDSNTYSITEFRNDSLKVKSISKKDCDLIEKYRAEQKTVLWRKDTILLVHLQQCD